MPGLAFVTNFLWVMVIGILGPSLPAMVTDLGISYAQAGFFFTLLSLGSLIGTSLGAISSDSFPRKLLYGGCVLALSVALVVLGFMPSYALIALVIFVMSTLGSPIGAVGQSIMLGMFPERRERYLSFMTFFGAVGSLLAPVLVTLNFSAGLSWRWTFREVAVVAFAVFIILLTVRIPRAPQGSARVPFRTILKHRTVLLSALLIFLSIGTDLGFSYWLAQYFKSELHASLRLSSSIVGVYLVGIISGRILIPVVLKKASPRVTLAGGLALSLCALLSFILVPWVPAKIALCAVYGLGIGPIFPLFVAQGTREFPEQAGAVTGVLYACMSLGGMVFPFLVGGIAGRWGIGNAYFFCAAVVAALLVMTLANRGKRPAPSGSQRARRGHPRRA